MLLRFFLDDLFESIDGGLDLLNVFYQGFNKEFIGFNKFKICAEWDSLLDKLHSRFITLSASAVVDMVKLQDSSTACFL